MFVVRIGTRSSALALWQAAYVAARLADQPDVHVETIELSSLGDERIDVPLADVDGTGFFTSTLERALLEGHIDVAVHSYKDLPVATTPGLTVAAVPPRGPVADVLCGRDGYTVATLPAGARVGTCSTRRTAQLQALRPDLDIQPLRGNVPTRVGRVSAGDLDAVVLAHAGLTRLALDAAITEIFTLEQMLPAPAQGALAVQCRAGDATVLAGLSALDAPQVRRAVDAERTMLHALGGGCSVPVGAVATCEGPWVSLTAAVFALDRVLAIRFADRDTDPVRLGQAAAGRLLTLGAGAILAEFDKAPRADWAPTPGDRT